MDETEDKAQKGTEQPVADPKPQEQQVTPEVAALQERLKESLRSGDAGEEEAAEPEGGAPEPDEKELAKALDALKRETPKALHKLIDEMDPAEALEQGQEALARRSDRSRDENKLDLLMKRIDALESPKTEGTDKETGGGDATQHSKGESSLDLSESLQSLDEDLYPDLRSTLESSLTGLAVHLENGMSEKLDSLLGAMKAEREGDVRRQLGERFPQLRDPEVYAEVRKVMREIDPVMEHDEGADLYDRITRTMVRAASLIGATKGLKSKPKRKGTDDQPPAPKRRPTSTERTMTPGDKQEAYLLEGLRTGSVAAARRVSGL